jgi:hypothetical protein
MSPVDPIPHEDYLHLKPRYDFRETCGIFDVHAQTLRAWMRRGVPLPNGRRARLTFVRLGLRKTVFFQEDIDRIQGLRMAAGGAELIEFPGPAERADLRAALPQRAVHALREARILAWRGPRGD